MLFNVQEWFCVCHPIITSPISFFAYCVYLIQIKCATQSLLIFAFPQHNPHPPSPKIDKKIKVIWNSHVLFLSFYFIHKKKLAIEGDANLFFVNVWKTNQSIFRNKKIFILIYCKRCDWHTILMYIIQCVTLVWSNVSWSFFFYQLFSICYSFCYVDDILSFVDW